MAPVDEAKTLKVGSPPLTSVVVNVLAAGARQALVAGLVWQIVNFSGRSAPPVSAQTFAVTVAVVLTAVARANAAEPLSGTSKVPLPDGVAANTTIEVWGPGAAS